jgi:surface polysaccharide O-acyltransferase-like enzyme
MEYGLDPYLRGMNWRCAVTCLWFGMACVSFSLTIVLSAREKTKHAISLPLFNGPNTFGAYWIHPLVIVPLAYLMSFTEIHPLVKFALVSISGVAFSFLVAEILRKIPLIKNIL